MDRCPLRPFKDDPKFFNEIFVLYSFLDKGGMPESGAVYDQPNAYIESITELNTAMADRHAVSEKVRETRVEQANEQIDKFKKLGFTIKKKNG